MDILKGKLLYICEKDKGLLFDKQGFFSVDLQNGQRELIMSLRPSGAKGVLSHFRLVSRLLRLEPRCMERLEGDRFVVCHTHKVWLLDIAKRSFTILQESRKGFSNPLNFCSDGVCVYWGDYGDNANHEEVNIYRLNPDLKLEIVYTVPQRTVRHIHNVIWDEANKRFFVLTGDMEEPSGIYTASADWSEVKPIVIGQQQYRAVVGFPHDDGLIYATDSVADANNIYLLQGSEVKTLCSFPGSCIYGTETKSHYVFASTVEPPEGRGFFNMFTYKLGKGIKDRYSHFITVRKSDLKAEEVLKLKKDIWPMKLFQYGSLMFPKGHKESEDLWYYVMACEGDGRTFRLEKKLY